MSESLIDFIEYVRKHCAVLGVEEGLCVRSGVDVVIESAPESVVAVLRCLRDDPVCDFALLCDITAVDYPERANRFDVIYTLLSVRHNRRAWVRFCVGEGQNVPSVASVFDSAVWYEREVWDMFGIPFAYNPDLRRILTDYGFDGHPLRKDFPLTGHVELRYDPELRRVAYAPVVLQQDYRDFDFISPWEGMDRLSVPPVSLPGDEKAYQQKTEDPYLSTPHAPRFGWRKPVSDLPESAQSPLKSDKDEI